MSTVRKDSWAGELLPDEAASFCRALRSRPSARSFRPKCGRRKANHSSEPPSQKSRRSR